MSNEERRRLEDGLRLAQLHACNARATLSYCETNCRNRQERAQRLAELPAAQARLAAANAQVDQARTALAAVAV